MTAVFVYVQLRNELFNARAFPQIVGAVLLRVCRVKERESVLNIFEPHRKPRCGLDGRLRRSEKNDKGDPYLFGAQRVCGPVAV
jgi:hypothetical protein